MWDLTGASDGDCDGDNDGDGRRSGLGGWLPSGSRPESLGDMATICTCFFFSSCLMGVDVESGGFSSNSFTDERDCSNDINLVNDIFTFRLIINSRLFRLHIPTLHILLHIVTKSTKKNLLVFTLRNLHSKNLMSLSYAYTHRIP